MKLINATMYHFRNGQRVNTNWIIGNEFLVDDSYKNYICNDINTIDPSLTDVEKKIEYYSMLKNNESPFIVGERMLELYREENCPDSIGRINCMYFCDENSLEFWANKFPDYYELYEVILSGEAFKSSPTLFPFGRANSTYEEFLSLCKEYWNPDLTSDVVDWSGEYLFQGKVFVRRKIDANMVRNRHTYNQKIV